MPIRNDSLRLAGAALILLAAPAARTDDAAKAADACDTVRAERVATQCAICHSFGKDEGTIVGPELWGAYGRKAASLAGFPFSKPFRALELSWDKATLDRFLTQPTVMVPGTMMAFAGLKDPADRAAIICKLEATR